MSDYYPDSSRFGVYLANTYQGVVGGIPLRVGAPEIDVADFGWDEAATGATNSAAFAAALAASSAGDIITIPAGEFTTDLLTINHAYPNRTIRGAGMDLTIIKPTNNKGFSIESPTDYGSAFNPNGTITAMTSGSAVITVADGSLFPSPSGSGTYRLGRIQLVNEDSTPIASVGPSPKIRSFSVVMISRSGNNITLSQPLPSDFSAGATGATFELAYQLAQILYGTGIENLTVDGTEGSAMAVGINISGTKECWLKNVKVLGQLNYGIQIYDSVNFEVRECWVDAGFGGGSNHGGLLCNTGSWGLVEDNVIVRNGPNIEINQSSSFNVFACNDLADGVLNCNHGPWNSFNLYEQNSCWYIITDGYFGGSSQETDYRNWFRSGLVTQQKRFSRQRNLVANVVGIPGETYSTDGSEHDGEPNIGNNNSIGLSKPSTGDWWIDWDVPLVQPKEWPGVLTARTNDTSGVITLSVGTGADFAAALAGSAGDYRGLGGYLIHVSSVVGDVVTVDTYASVLPVLSSPVAFTPSQDGFQELDEDVSGTTVKKENWYVLTGDVPAGESIGSDTLPPSYYRTSKPAFFGSLEWPAYGPEVGEDTEVGLIPASVRFQASLPPEAPTITTPCTVSGSGVEGQLLTAIPGSVTGNPVPTRTWKWQKDGVDIGGATSQTYTPLDSDVGSEIGPVQIETNSISPFTDESVATPVTILEFTGDILVVTQVANTDPVTELWRRGALTSGVSGPLEYYTVQHSGPYPTQPDNNYVYARFGTPQDNVYVFQGTISQAEAIASVP